MSDPKGFTLSAQKVLTTEARAISNLIPRIGQAFERACEILAECKGRIVVTGMGKSGHIAKKIAATLASTGSPAFFVHPGEASHGDLGMIRSDDSVVAISNSGETEEIIVLLPVIKRLNVNLITFTGDTKSTLASNATVNIDVTVDEEACPLGLAPTSSTTAALAMGDALAIALLESRGFTKEDFAMSHPGGKLGRRLLLLVNDLMHTDDALPVVNSKCTLKDALIEMSNKGLGMTAVIDDKNKVIGVFTDGDLRRIFDGQAAPLTTPIVDLIRHGCITVKTKTLAAEALKIMEDKKINGLLVVDTENTLIGALNMHDLLRAKVV